MNKYNNPRLLNTVVSGTGMKHPMLPHVVVGDVSNGFIRGDLMDANAIVELINNIIGGAPDTLDTLKEAADRIAALEHDTRDWLGQDNTLASRVDGLFKSLRILQHSEEYGGNEDSGLLLKFLTERFDNHAENRYLEYFIPQATSTRNGVMSRSQAQTLEETAGTLTEMLDPTLEGSLANKIAALENELDEENADSFVSKINSTIEDDELTISAALNDLNSRFNKIDSSFDTLLNDILLSVIDQLNAVSTKLDKTYDTLMPLEFGDYLLSDLKTKVRQANITEDQKADVVGICIGLNPYTKKDVFVNVDEFTSSVLSYVQFYTGGVGLPSGVFTTYASSEQTGTIGSDKINDEVLLNDTAKIAGKITASRDISVTSGDIICQVNDFAGLHNTIEWAKLAKAGNGTINQYPVLQRIFGYSGITSFDDVNDDYNGWFLGSTGYGVMMCPMLETSDEKSQENFNVLKSSIYNLGKSYKNEDYCGSSFYYQSVDALSSLHYLNIAYDRMYWKSRTTGGYVSGGYRLFALIER